MNHIIRRLLSQEFQSRPAPCSINWYKFAQFLVGFPLARRLYLIQTATNLIRLLFVRFLRSPIQGRQVFRKRNRFYNQKFLLLFLSPPSFRDAWVVYHADSSLVTNKIICVSINYCIVYSEIIWVGIKWHTLFFIIKKVSFNM